MQSLRAQRTRQLSHRPVRAEPAEALGTSPAQVFKDPDFLAFLGLRQGHDKAALEAAILR